MRTGMILAGALFVGAASAALRAAQAEPLAGGEIQARSAGGEFRGYGPTRRSPLEDVIWRLRPDGSVASYSVLRRKYPSGSQFEEYSDFGRWRVDGNRLCVEFPGVHSEFTGCYGVDGAMGDHVRLVGPVQLEGTLGH